MSGPHIVLFNHTDAGMTYRLYTLPKMHSSRALAEASGGENSLIQSVIFAPEGLDVDFPLTWRPATMHNHVGPDDYFMSIDSIPFIVVTYESSTRLFYLPSFLPSSKYTSMDIQDGTPPSPEQMLFPNPPIELPYVRKRHYADHVRITSGFKSAFLVWFDANDEWQVLPTRYDTHIPPPAPNSSATPPNQTSPPPAHRCFEPRFLGQTYMSLNRLCLSPALGMAFYMEDHDRRQGHIHMLEWIIPPKGVDHVDPLEADFHVDLLTGMGEFDTPWSNNNHP